MRKKIVGISILIILVGIGVILGKKFVYEPVQDIEPVIWSCYSTDTNGYVNGGAIYSYDVQNKEKKLVGNIALDYISSDGKGILTGVQNMFPNANGFQGIVTYNTYSGEIVEVISTSRIFDMLEGDNHSFYGNIQMDSSQENFYFLYGGKMFKYAVNEDRLTILFDTPSNQCVLSQNEESLYFTENQCLYLYNLQKDEKVKLLEGVYRFAISSDEDMIAYENKSEKKICLYIVSTKENKEIVQLKHSGVQLHISDNSKYLLFTDYKELIIPTNYNIEIGIYDFVNNQISIVYKGTAEENFRTVLF